MKIQKITEIKLFLFMHYDFTLIKTGFTRPFSMIIIILRDTDFLNTKKLCNDEKIWHSIIMIKSRSVNESSKSALFEELISRHHL